MNLTEFGEGSTGADAAKWVPGEGEIAGGALLEYRSITVVLIARAKMRPAGIGVAP